MTQAAAGMALALYDLASADGRILSPFGWRSHLALAHKGLAAETVRVRFVDKAAIAFAGSKTTPVLVDGAAIVADSWRIAEHLEAAHPDRPSLFGGAAAQALAFHVNEWCGLRLVPRIALFVLPDMADRVVPEDRDYLRRTREAAFGRSFEEMRAGREAALPGFRAELEPLRRALARTGFLHGAAPGYADYVVEAAFRWAEAASDFQLLAADDALRVWRAALDARLPADMRRSAREGT